MVRAQFFLIRLCAENLERITYCRQQAVEARHPLMCALEIGLKLGIGGIVQLAREHFLFFGEGHR